MIIIVFGLPGSGKSYFATHLADQLSAVYISSDRVRNEMFDKKTYLKAEKILVYNEMLVRMKMAATQRSNVVLDATFFLRSIRMKFYEQGKKIDRTVFIEIVADEDLTAKRLRKQRPESEADFEVYKKIKSEWEPMAEEHLVLQSADNNISDMLQKTANYLGLTNDKRTN